VENPRYYRSAEQRLARTQRVASRRHGPRKGVAASNRWKRANSRVQRTHHQVADSRRNLLHETTTYLAKNYDLIVVEDLNVKGMLKNRSLAKHISDAAWSEFVRQLEYKTTWYGSVLVRVDRFYPSTKTCSSCGAVKVKLPMEMREYTCEVCDLVLDRDLNAAINRARCASDESAAGTSSVAGRGGKVRPERRKFAATAHPSEASTDALTMVDV
jgi:putative transposase